MATSKKTAATPDSIEPTPAEETLTVSVVVEFDPKTTRQKLLEAQAEFERSAAIRAEAEARYKAAAPDRDVSAADLGDLQREVQFAVADYEAAGRRASIANRKFEQSRTKGDRRIADYAADLLRANLPNAFKGLTVTGSFTVLPAGNNGVNGVYRSGEIHLKYEGGMDTDIIALAVTKALAGQTGSQVNGRKLAGASRCELTVTMVDEELAEKERQRQARLDEAGRIEQSYTTGGYR